MTAILLLRHGQSTWNADGRWQGQADPPLSDLGRRQATDGAQALSALAIDHIVSSDLRRAAETAALLASPQRLGPLTGLSDFRERNAGEWQGLTKDAIESQWPGYLATGNRPPGFEEADSVLRRVTGALHKAARSLGDGRLVVVTHGGVIRALERQFDPQPPAERIANLGGRWVSVDEGSIALGDRLVLVDDRDLTRPAET